MRSYVKAMQRPSDILISRGLLQRKCDNCSEKQLFQRYPSNHSEPASVPHIVHKVLHTSGQPLSPEIRTFFEPRFGHDFSRVRVHTDAKAAESAKAVNSLAYTVGRDIVFGTGQYTPETNNGKRLVAHELTHTLQQRQHSRFGSANRISLLRDPGEEIAEKNVKTSMNGSVSSLVKGISANVPNKAGLNYLFPVDLPLLTDIHVARASAAGETWAEVHQRILKGLIDITKAHLGEEERRQPLYDLFESVPANRAKGLYDRLNPGAVTDDFAQYLKNNFPHIRSEALNVLKEKFAAPLIPSDAQISTGENVVAAATSFPSGVHFIGDLKTGNGIELNPEYWIVEYVLSRGDEQHLFVNSQQTSAMAKAGQFFEANPSWRNNGTRIDVRIRVGSKGASEAIKDMWNSESAKNYTMDCYVAATLVELRGIYNSYLQRAAATKFDRDYRSFQIELKPERVSSTLIPSSEQISGERNSPSSLERLPGEKEPLLMTTTEYQQKLKPGDWVVIRNPYAEGAWMAENAIYKGNGHFFGHPIGDFTFISYSEYVMSNLVSGYIKPLNEEERNKCLTEYGDKTVCDLPKSRTEVLQKSYIIPLNRPLQRIPP